tara:strand:- start:4550 stop:5464 length:915 start_codon:yes stop_codon:yes gene_type:complete
MAFWTDSQDYNTQVQDLIPFDTSVITSTKMRDFLQASIRSIIDAIPVSLLSNYAFTESFTALGADTVGFNSTNKKIISVHFGDKVAAYRPYDPAIYANANSIHLASISSPIYTINQRGQVLVYPHTGSASSLTKNIIYTEYPQVLSTDGVIAKRFVYTGLSTDATNDEITGISSSSITNEDVVVGAEVYIEDFTEATQLNAKWATISAANTTSGDIKVQMEGETSDFNITQSETSNTGKVTVYYPYPRTLDNAMVLSTAIKVSQFLLSRLIHTDEDIELVNAMQIELANLKDMYKEEMGRIIGQ